MVLYYAVVRELYSADAPDWVVGGARGGPSGIASGYVTAQVVRALSAVIRSIKRTATYLGVLAQIQEPNRMPDTLQHWQSTDRLRRNLFLHTTLAKHSWNLVLPVERPVPDEKDGDDPLPAFLQRIRGDINGALKKCRERFETARAEIDTFRNSEQAVADKEFQRRVKRSESAHYIGREAVADAISLITEAELVFEKAADEAIKEKRLAPNATYARRFQVELVELKALFQKAAIRAGRLLLPAERYLSAVLDENLARALSGGEHRLGFDAIELACSAASVGAIATGNDERIPRAAECLIQILSDDGFPKGRPFHREGKIHFEANQFQALRCFAHLLEVVPDELFTVDTMEKLARYFRKRRTEMREKEHGSTWQDASGDRQRSVLETAIAALALDRITHLLSRRINEIILRYFPRRNKGDLQLKNLFYADYGGRSESSVAIVLERMCAHLVSVSLPRFEKALLSAVFYGPPGTGKTTLVEALAASSGANLIEVTPSDIVVRGADAIEERARAVFTALSFLTNTVILFDEFEQVLLDRSTDDSASRSIFHFLTPGMLPKLKRLHESAEQRQLAYVLLTNHLTALDGAAIRPGRFDVCTPIYPPDVLSRAGRLWSEAVALNSTEKGIIEPKRLAEAIRQMAFAPMEVVGKPGWFTKPEVVKSQTLFAYLTGKDTDAPRIAAVVPLDPENPSSTNPTNDQKAWMNDAGVKMIWKWDQAARGTAQSDVPDWMSLLITQLDAWKKGDPLIPAAK